MENEILLYYKYINIENPQEVTLAQKTLCKALGFKGRIIVAKEGINGTLEGTKVNTQKYIDFMNGTELFRGINFKRSPGNGHAFPKLSVKCRNEIVSAHLGDEDVDPSKITGKYLSVEELHDWYRNGKEFYIVDMRNDYEHRSGYFKGSILPKLSNFRDLPKIIPDLEHLRNKTIVTVCTGGVRCEKASGYLVTKGFADVYQLKDGIVTYMERYPNEDFLGKLYVFDNRVLMGFNTDSKEHQTVGHCEICGRSAETYINCKNNNCHKHMIVCDECLDGQKTAYCSLKCQEECMIVAEVWNGID